MSAPVAPTGSPVLSLAPTAKPEREKLAEAARQFEAIFVRQMLSTARQTSFDKDGLFSSQGMDTFRQMQDERLADIASQRGSFGLAKMIEARMARFVPPETKVTD
jgi:flagellar protein FlgJ